MQHQIPTTQDTSPGTLNNSLNETAPQEAVTTGPTRDDLNRFSELIARALEAKKEKETPEIEVPRRVVEYFNKTNLKGFDEVGYFVFNGVKVYERGKKEEAKRKDSETIEQKMHGGK